MKKQTATVNKSRVRAGFIVFSLLMAFLFIEGFLRLAGQFSSSPMFSIRTIKKSLQSVKAESQDVLPGKETDNPEWMTGDQIHPYLGFIEGYSDTNAWQKLDTNRTSEPDTITIAVFGGSVAYWFNRESQQYLIDLLHTYPAFSGKKIRVISTAIGGYKQPQQLIALNLLLLTGHTIDIAINIDGFNDIALPYSDNFTSHITPYYPRLWNLYARKGLPPSLYQTLFSIEITRTVQKSLASRISGLPQHSATALFAWNLLNTSLSNRIVTLNNMLAKKLTAMDRDYQVTGPDADIDTLDQLTSYGAKIWANGSKQMKNIAASNKILYVHVLQPNQYVKNSKPFSQEETKMIRSVLDGEKYTAEYAYATAVMDGYPKLEEEGRALQQDGVLFYDATYLFSKEHQTLYSDSCCHYTKEGYDILARYISAILLRSYR